LFSRSVSHPVLLIAISYTFKAWVYEEELLKLSGGELCLDLDSSTKKVKLSVCDSEKATQKWKLKVLQGL